MAMRVDCRGNSSGSEADDDEELEDGTSEGTTFELGTAFELEEGGAKNEVVEGGTKSGGHNVGSMFNGEEEPDESNDNLESDEPVEGWDGNGPAMLVIDAEWSDGV